MYAVNIELFGYNQHLGKMMALLEPEVKTAVGKEKWQQYKKSFALQAEKNVHLNAGQRAQNFTGVDINGKQHSLADFTGKVVVVDVWNTGCKPCIAEIPFLKKLEKRFANEEVVFISYSLENTEDKWKNFVRERQLEGQQWIETKAFKSDFAHFYNVKYVPRFMVFGRDGKIVETYAPRPSDPRLGVIIEKALKK